METVPGKPDRRLALFLRLAGLAMKATARRQGRGMSVRLLLSLTGQGGGEWTVDLQDGRSRLVRGVELRELLRVQVPEPDEVGYPGEAPDADERSMARRDLGQPIEQEDHDRLVEEIGLEPEHHFVVPRGGCQRDIFAFHLAQRIARFELVMGRRPRTPLRPPRPHRRPRR